MNIQYLIVFIIILGAAIYVGNSFWKKVKSSSKGSCGTDCGCSGGSKKLPS
ncbi:MAG: FeoB-associated Cys-rich membrane protein [Pyrinomonadaceae bacterium]